MVRRNSFTFISLGAVDACKFDTEKKSFEGLEKWKFV